MTDKSVSTTSFHSLGITSHADANRLSRAGFHSPEAILAASDDQLAGVVTQATLAQIHEASGLTRLGLDKPQLAAVRKAGYLTAAAVRKATDEQLLAVEGIGEKTLAAVRKAMEKKAAEKG